MYRSESWTIKKVERWRINSELRRLQPWHWRRLLRVPFKEIKPVNPEGNQSWIFIGRTDAEAETPILWPSDAKNWLIWKDPDAGKDWRQKEKRMAEDEMVGWHHQWTWVWVDSGSWWWTGRAGMLQSRDHKESDMTECLNRTEGNSWAPKWENNLTKIMNLSTERLQQLQGEKLSMKE